MLKLGIWVNKDFFNHDHVALMPYAEAHELYEAWQLTNPGMTVETAHLLARQHQFNLAALDNNANKLLEFYMSVNPSAELELLNAHAIATSS